MRHEHHGPRWFLALAMVTTTACTGADPGDGPDSDAAEVTWADARPIIEAKCARCHTADRLSTYRRLETHTDVSNLRDRILVKITNPDRGLVMPLASNHVDDEGCEPPYAQLDDKRLTEDERATLTEYLVRDDHGDYVDPFDPIPTPEVPRLAGATEYPSSQYDVVNDGFLRHPNADRHGFMHEHRYDEREFDQMEDDWFCIEFDPQRTEPGYLTGTQVLLGIGQIYLNSQLVIDTTGASAQAKAAADDSGPDWYRCDGGLNFADAIPLWRTVPGGAAVELPPQTGLRFEPGWTFVLRVDQHTHFDAAEFERLDQSGVIDRDAGTMTWFNQLSLLVRWARPDDVTRELKWLTVGPRTQAERDAFVVVPGESTHDYAASLPAGDGPAVVFSAEVGAGKHAKTVSLLEASSQTCIANNSDFAPKWIEQVIYDEADAPRLDDDSSLRLRCAYRNTEGENVEWGQESEATVWGKKERCGAVVHYYEALR